MGFVYVLGFVSSVAASKLILGLSFLKLSGVAIKLVKPVKLSLCGEGLSSWLVNCVVSSSFSMSFEVLFVILSLSEWFTSSVVWWFVSFDKLVFSILLDSFGVELVASSLLEDSLEVGFNVDCVSWLVLELSCWVVFKSSDWYVDSSEVLSVWFVVALSSFLLVVSLVVWLSADLTWVSVSVSVDVLWLSVSSSFRLVDSSIEDGLLFCSNSDSKVVSADVLLIWSSSDLTSSSSLDLLSFVLLSSFWEKVLSVSAALTCPLIPNTSVAPISKDAVPAESFLIPYLLSKLGRNPCLFFIF